MAINSNVHYALLTRDQNNELNAPHVGIFYPTVSENTVCQGGDTLGLLDIVGVRVPILIPESVGVVRIQGVSKSPVHCGYNSKIVSFISLHATDSQGDIIAGNFNSSSVQTDRPSPTSYSVDAPIDGTVYYAPSPENPPFVQEGQIVNPGDIIALVEVMKFFYEIHYEGTACANAVKKPHQDGDSIEAGAPLWWLEPI